MTQLRAWLRTPSAFAVAVVVVAVGIPIADGARARAASSDGTRIIEQMRAAASEQDFLATVDVTWRTASGEHREAMVDVGASDGTLTLSSGSQLVLDERGHTFVKDDRSWWTPAKEPRASDPPAPDTRWRLAVHRGTTLGRPTTTVVAQRGDGSVAQRLVIDDATHVLVGRDVVASDGTIERGFRFTSFIVGPAASGVVADAPTPDVSGRDATELRDVSDEFDAPTTLGDGYRLVSRSAHGDAVRLVYSDGLFTLSVLEEPGELDWDALPDGGTSATVDGARARRYAEALGDVIVWERDGVVFTSVADAPRDSYVGAMASITAAPGVVDQVVDFVLAPFGFD